LTIHTHFVNNKVNAILSLCFIFSNSVLSDSRRRIAEWTFVRIEPCRDFVLSHGRRPASFRRRPSEIPIPELSNSRRRIHQHWRHKPRGNLSTGSHVLTFRFVFGSLENRSSSDQKSKTCKLHVHFSSKTYLSRYITGNQRIASWMNAPESQFLLKFVRPDFLMLRTLAKGLILWDDICPTRFVLLLFVKNQ